MFISFKIKFPTQISNANKGKLREALDTQSQDMKVDAGIKEKYTLAAYKENHRNTNHEGGQRGKF